MITLSQSKIDAPDFPRPQEWWTRFLPGWVTGTVNPDGTVTIAPDMEDLPPRGNARVAAATRNRNRELGMLRWLHGLSRLEVAIVEEPGKRCQCWRGPARLHNGHCCFDGSQPVRICHSMPESMRQPGAEIPA